MNDQIPFEIAAIIKAEEWRLERELSKKKREAQEQTVHLEKTAWLIERGDTRIVIMLWLVLSAGGLAVGLLYLLDWVINQVWGKREAEQREQMLLEQRDGKSKSA